MDDKKVSKKMLLSFVLLHLIMLLYSFSSVFSKKASDYSLLSLEFVVYYGLVMVILFIYAIAWQQVLKRMELTTAYANKAVVVIWGLILGWLFYGEAVTVKKVLACIIIMIGVGLVVTDQNE